WGDLAAAIAFKGAAILIFALAATRVLRRQPAAVRHGVWLVALLAQLGTPMLGALLPAWRPTLPAWTLTIGVHRDASPRRAARRAERVTDGEWLTLATQVSNEMGLRRPVVLLRGHGLAVPVTWGILVPVVLLPIEAEDWTLERRRTVLLHELAHVRRLDMLSQLAAHV